MSLRNFYRVLWLLIVTNSIVRAQQFEQFYPPFYANGKRLINATAGGLRNGQFSNIDFNNDGIQDLFVFDKTQEKPLTFLGVDDGEEFRFEYAPQYESIFPKMYFFALLHDFNKDGVEDLFTLTTRSVGGINLWKGSRNGNDLSFKEVIYRTDGFNSIQTKNLGGSGIYYNLPYAFGDIPSITDVDFDGDLDILCFDTDQGAKLYYYRNYALEKGLGLDTMDMVTEDLCFGKFYESAFDQELFLSPNGFDCAARATDGDTGKPRHPGSTVLAFDNNCDSLIDLLIGDLANYGLTLAINGGTRENAWMTSQDIHFPSNDVPVNFPLFHGAFLVDVNNDKIKDLIVTPSESDGGDNINHIWCYINHGTNCAPDFKLSVKNFLIGSMISTGGRSEVTNIDINADGLLDLIIGSNGLKIGDNNKVDRLYYYKNTGTSTAPEFTLENDNFLDMDAKSDFAGSLSPHAGDIDGDHDVDLLIGDSDGQLYFFQNNSGPGNPAVFASFLYPFEDIFIGSAAKPVLFDDDGDGLNDLFVGEQNNFFNYFKNHGSIGNAVFNTTPDDDNFGDLFPNANNSYLWFGSPSFFKVEDEKINLFMGFNNGTLGLYEKINDQLIRIDSAYQDREFGLKATPEVVDIDNDGFYDLIVGNQSGGIQFFHTEFKTSTSATDEVDPHVKIVIYPNPVTNDLFIDAGERGSVVICDAVGKLIVRQNLILGKNRIDTHHLSTGVYVVKFLSELNQVASFKFAKF